MPRRRFTADDWWRMAEDMFQKVIMEYLKRAKKADLEETGHDCGHEWTITITSRGHYVLAEDLAVEEHSDAKYVSPYQPVVVRAHNLRDALLLAAAEPLDSWFPTIEDGEDIAGDILEKRREKIDGDDDHEIVDVNGVKEEVLKEDQEPTAEELNRTIQPRPERGWAN